MVVVIQYCDTPMFSAGKKNPDWSEAHAYRAHLTAFLLLKSLAGEEVKHSDILERTQVWCLFDTVDENLGIRPSRNAHSKCS